MTESFTESEARLLAPYVTRLDGDVFCLRNLPEEVIAVLFAYYSRSPDSLRRNLVRLIRQGDLDVGGAGPATPDGDGLAGARDKARAFHEKWVVGYGHGSVAEHAVAHVAVEDVSILASKALEDVRLASFTEKSTRYVVFDRDRWHRPAELRGTPEGALLEEHCNALMDGYREMMPVAREWLERRSPHDPGGRRSRAVHDGAIRAQACDVLRYLLPASTCTNVGVTINGRSLESAISKLLSHPLAEVRRLGESVKEESRHVIPTLVKYAEASPYRVETEAAMAKEVAGWLEAAGVEAGALPEDLGSDAGAGNRVRLVRWEADAEVRLVEAILYRFSDLPYGAARRAAEAMDAETRGRVLDEYLGRRGRHDPPLRELEHVTYTFDLVMDYGAFRDVQRHRIATQSNQDLGCDLGYATPVEVEEMGLGDAYRRHMERSHETWERIRRGHPACAPYAVPLAFRKRVLFTWNLRSLAHFVALRSSRQGHVSYRRVAQQVFREVQRVHPHLARHLRVDLNDHDLARG